MATPKTKTTKKPAPKKAAPARTPGGKAAPKKTPPKAATKATTVRAGKSTGKAPSTPATLLLKDPLGAP